jgi:predicted DNA-binding protein (UPF0251 family)
MYPALISPTTIMKGNKMTRKHDIAARIARDYFNIQDMDAAQPVTVSRRVLRAALEAAFEAGQGLRPDTLAIARAITTAPARNALK